MSREVSIEIDGKKYIGEYDASGGMVTVWTEGGEKTTQIGGSPVMPLAEILLRNLVRDGKTKPV